MKEERAVMKVRRYSDESLIGRLLEALGLVVKLHSSLPVRRKNLPPPPPPPPDLANLQSVVGP